MVRLLNRFITKLSTCRTLGLLLIFIYILQITIPGFTEEFISNPNNTNVKGIITSIFLHTGWIHLFFNTILLLFPNVIKLDKLEDKVGGLSIIFIFIISGVIGNLSPLTWSIGGIGASGGLMGLIGALLATKLISWEVIVTQLIFDIVGLIFFFIFGEIVIGHDAHLLGLGTGWLLMKSRKV